MRLYLLHALLIYVFKFAASERMADKIMDIGAPFISAIETPRESILSVPVHDDRLDRRLQANEQVNCKDELATELSTLRVDHHRNAS
ncbi:hypothetical protein MRX96_057420 [Rhipicephalus microplus]